MEKIKNYSSLFLNVLLIFIIFYLIFSVIQNLKSEIKAIDKNNYALLDSIKVLVDKQGNKTFSNNVPQIDPNELTKSEFFKTLSDEQKKYYEELKKEKRLIAALQQKIISQDSLISSIAFGTKGNNPTINNDSLICYDKGTVLDLGDSIGNLKLNYDLKFGDKSLDKKISYLYHLKLEQTWTVDKKKNILVKTKFDDKNVSLKNQEGLLIPYDEQGKTKLGKWIRRNEKWVKPLSKVITHTGVFYLGTKVK